MNLQDLPPDLFRNAHFARYFRTWTNNDQSIVFVPLAEICREKGFLDEALEICREGLEKQPQSVAGRLMLAKILYEKDEMEQAQEVVSDLLSQYPAHAEARAFLQRIKKASTPETVSTNKTPRKVLPWENVTMAKIYAEQGEKKIAMEIVSRLLSLDPSHSRALALREELIR